MNIELVSVEDKYKEREKDSRERSPLREPNYNPAPDRRMAWMEGTGGTTSSTTTGYKSATGSTLAGLSSFQQTMPGTHADLKFDSRSAALKELAIKYKMNLTDARAAAETDIQFINDDEDNVLTQEGGVRGYMELPGRWTRVDVDVPTGAVATSRQREVSRKVTGSMASTYPPKSSLADPKAGLREAPPSADCPGVAPPQVNSTYTINGASSSSTSPSSSRWRPKKSLRDLEHSSGKVVEGQVIVQRLKTPHS